MTIQHCTANLETKFNLRTMLITLTRVLINTCFFPILNTISLKLHKKCRSLCTILSSKSANIAQNAVFSSPNRSQLVLISDVHLKEMRPLISN